MTRVLVVYGSRHGATRGVAERIGETLRAAGCAADVESAETQPEIRGADGVVVGSAVYMGNWLKEPLAFIRRNQAELATRPFWLFSSGPLAGSSAEKAGVDPITDAFGPEDGPGSGGRKKMAELSAATLPRDHRVFLGAFDPSDPPRTMAERIVRLLPASKGMLPVGDFREWDAIDAWACEIAAVLSSDLVAT